jgi:hypothetical protein
MTSFGASVAECLYVLVYLTSWARRMVPTWTE